MVGILYLSQFRAGLIDARVQSLLVQGEIIAGAIAASATVDSDGITIDPRPAARAAARRELRPDRRSADRARILDQSRARRAGAAPADFADQHARAHLRPRRLPASSTAATSTSRGDVLRFDLPPPDQREARAVRAAPGSRSARWLGRGDLPLYHELGADAGKDYPEVAQALTGTKSAYMVRVNDRGEVIVSVAVPVQRFRAVRGALLLSTQGGDIDQVGRGRAAADRQACS